MQERTHLSFVASLGTTSGASLCMMLVLLTLSFGCKSVRLPPRTPGQAQVVAPPIAEVIYDGGFSKVWSASGKATFKTERGKPLDVSFPKKGSLTIIHSGALGRYSGLTFRFFAPADLGDFLEVRVDSSRSDVFPRVRIDASRRADAEGGWTEVIVPMSDLNPNELGFDRVVFRATTDIGDQAVAFDKVGFVPADAITPAQIARVTGPVRETLLAIDCLGKTHRISPLIYGISNVGVVSKAPKLKKDSRDDHVFSLGATAARWGGNPTSRYNWQINAWNVGNDWFFRNTQIVQDTDYSVWTFMEEAMANRMETAITVPLIGWVAKDHHSFPFSGATYGKQQKVDPAKPWIGNGVKPNGTLIAPPPPNYTSVPGPPGLVGRFVQEVVTRDKAAKTRSVGMYILDNEPALWNSTHRDVHPYPVTYDELLERTIEYGSAVRKASPSTLIAGPAAWGWPEYFFSAADQASGFEKKPDRLAHGDTPLLEWYLKKLKEHEEKTGTKILDVLDVHFYPQAEKMGVGLEGGTEPADNAIRLRSTRGLWDAGYTDESWIKEPIRLLPRLHELIDKHYPGTRISIGEWNFGAEKHMSGGLAVAEALGRFGEHDVYSAFYWTYPAKDSPAASAFKAYRNFDGQGGHFLDYSLPTRGAPLTSLFASRDESGEHVVAVALNMSPDQAARAQIDVGMCGDVLERKSFVMTPQERNLVPYETKTGEGGVIQIVLPAYSVTVFDLKVRRAGTEKAPRLP